MFSNGSKDQPPARGFHLVQNRESMDDEVGFRRATMNTSIITSLYVFAVVFVSLGGLVLVVKMLTGRRRDDAPLESPEHDPRLLEAWFDEPAHRRQVPTPPMFPQSDAEHFHAAHEALEQNLPVLLPLRAPTSGRRGEALRADALGGGIRE